MLVKLCFIVILSVHKWLQICSQNVVVVAIIQQHNFSEDIIAYHFKLLYFGIVEFKSNSLEFFLLFKFIFFLNFSQMKQSLQNCEFGISLNEQFWFGLVDSGQYLCVFAPEYAVDKSFCFLNWSVIAFRCVIYCRVSPKPFELLFIEIQLQQTGVLQVGVRKIELV